jgi:hypothetical protein
MTSAGPKPHGGHDYPARPAAHALPAMPCLEPKAGSLPALRRGKGWRCSRERG